MGGAVEGGGGGGGGGGLLRGGGYGRVGLGLGGASRWGDFTGVHQSRWWLSEEG